MLWELGDIDETVILDHFKVFFLTCMMTRDGGWRDGEFDVHCDP